MTPPREPDRYEAKAKELCLTEWRPIAAALRQAADEALDEVRQYVDAMPVCTRAGVLRLLDDLQAPAGPAAETEPLLPRVLAALEWEASFHVPGRLRRTQLDALAAELRAYIAEMEGKT